MKSAHKRRIVRVPVTDPTLAALRTARRCLDTAIAIRAAKPIPIVMPAEQVMRLPRGCSGYGEILLITEGSANDLAGGGVGAG